MYISEDRQMKKFLLRRAVPERRQEQACDFLSEAAGLSRSKIKDAMNKGAVRLTTAKGRTKRLRRATSILSPGDVIELFYDERLLLLEPPQAVCLSDLGHYSVWYKPAGLMTQGNDYGDHCSIARQVELAFNVRRPVFVIHRLDRETSGIVLIGHSRQAAAALSELFRRHAVTKKYRAVVRGCLDKEGHEGVIDLPLDKKPALTRYRVISYNLDADTSTVEAEIITGRLHQIRRHFDMIGHPVMGDPRYGRGNADPEGLRLKSVAISFRCPFSGRNADYTVPESLQSQP